MQSVVGAERRGQMFVMYSGPTSSFLLAFSYGLQTVSR